MTIVLCLKLIPADMVDKNKLSAEKYTVNPYDLHVLKKMLDLKEQKVFNLVCLCMGPMDTRDELHRLYALGVDEVILVSDKMFSGSDTYATSFILSKALEQIEYDYIICGAEAIDGETGQVPFGIAQRLNLYCQQGVTEILNMENGTIQFMYEDDKHLYQAAGEGPMLFIFKDFSTEPLNISLRAMKKTRSREISIFNGESLSINHEHCGQKGSLTKVISAKNTMKNRNNIEINGSSEEKSAFIMKMLKTAIDNGCDIKSA